MHAMGRVSTKQSSAPDVVPRQQNTQAQQKDKSGKRRTEFHQVEHRLHPAELKAQQERGLAVAQDADAQKLLNAQPGRLVASVSGNKQQKREIEDLTEISRHATQVQRIVSAMNNRITRPRPGVWVANPVPLDWQLVMAMIVTETSPGTPQGREFDPMQVANRDHNGPDPAIPGILSGEGRTGVLVPPNWNLRDRLRPVRHATPTGNGDWNHRSIPPRNRMNFRLSLQTGILWKRGYSGYATRLRYQIVAVIFTHGEVGETVSKSTMVEEITIIWLSSTKPMLR